MNLKANIYQVVDTIDTPRQSMPAQTRVLLTYDPLKPPPQMSTSIESQHARLERFGSVRFGTVRFITTLKQTSMSVEATYLGKDRTHGDTTFGQHPRITNSVNASTQISESNPAPWWR